MPDPYFEAPEKTFNERVKPGLQHAAVGLLIQGLCGIIGAWWWGFIIATAVFTMRARTKSEYHFKDSSIPLWKWRPRSLRDIGWPALATALVATAMGYWT